MSIFHLAKIIQDQLKGSRNIQDFAAMLAVFFLFKLSSFLVRFFFQKVHKVLYIFFEIKKMKMFFVSLLILTFFQQPVRTDVMFL